MIAENKLHRLPIIEEDANLVLGMINIEDLFQFFFENYIGEEEIYQKPFSEITMGTYGYSIQTCLSTSSVAYALGMM
jgi:hypothetical protein